MALSFRQQVGLAVFSSVSIILGVWAFQLFQLEQQLLKTATLQREAFAQAKAGDFIQAEQSFLALQKAQAALDTRAVNYSLVHQMFHHPPLLPARTLQENLNDLEKLKSYDYRAQLLTMKDADQRALAQDKDPSFQYSYTPEIQAGGLKQVKAFYAQNQSEIDAERKANRLVPVAHYRPNSGSGFSSEPSVAKSASSRLYEVENTVRGLLIESSTLASQKKVNEALALTSEASNYLLKAVTTQTISQTDFVRIDAKISEQNKKILNIKG